METGTCARKSMHKTEMQINPQIPSASVELKGTCLTALYTLTYKHDSDMHILLYKHVVFIHQTGQV